MTPTPTTTTSARYTVDRARRLALIRQLLLRAERDAELAEPLHAQALLGVHDAAELFLVLAAEATSAGVKASAQFLEYWQPLDDALAPETLGHRASMKAISDARRGFKHSGVIPSRAEIQRFARAVREFLVDGSKSVFDVDFDRVTMSDLIPTQHVRDHVKNAETELAAGNLNEAVGSAKLAFEALMHEEPPGENATDRDWRMWRQRETFNFDSAFFLKLGNLVDDNFGRSWDKMIKAVTSNETAILMLSKGVNYDDYLKFEALTPVAVRLMGREDAVLNFDARLQLTADEAAWCVEFATIAALNVESRT